MKPIEYADASAEVRAVFDDIKRTRGVADVNNFWKYLAHDPAGLRRTWESLKEVMAPGALDPLVKEMVYLAVSVSNGCAAMNVNTNGSGFGRRSSEMTLVSSNHPLTSSRPAPVNALPRTRSAHRLQVAKPAVHRSALAP